MHRFAVWAPKRTRVAVSVDGEVLPLQGPDERGWWTLDHPTAAHGSRYGFRVDDDTHDYPDPRSLWQPDGVHGLSAIYDSTAYEWHDAHFQAVPLASAILYEMHVGTFSVEGTFDAAIHHLDHLVDLGVTHVEVLPIASFEGRHGWGYDGTALFAPHQAYGGPDAVKRFVDACHQCGLGVLLDVVYNHFGPSGNYTGIYGYYLNEHHMTPWGAAVNFEVKGSDETRRFVVDNVLVWLRDYHFDGLRLDAIHEFVDRSAVHILEQMSCEVGDLSAATGRTLVLIGESDLNDPRVVTPRAANGLGLDAQWSDDFHHALFRTITGEKSGYYADFDGIYDLAKSLEQIFVYDGAYSTQRSRSHGRPATALSFHHFIGYMQNHDQVGNRAQGDRLSQIVSFKRAQIAAALVLTAPFVPMIFQGEEWAASTPFQFFADHLDEHLRHGVTEGRKREFAAFGWDPKDVPDPENETAFTISKLNWQEVGQPQHARMFDWYRALIHLRRDTPELNHGTPGSVRTEVHPDRGAIVVYRGPIVVLANLGETSRSFTLTSPPELLLANYALSKSSSTDSTMSPASMEVPAESVAIVKLRYS